MTTVSLKSPEGKYVVVTAILASSMTFIDATALNVVLPSLQKNLHASGVDLFWLLNAYLLMLAALIMTGGSLGDRFGRKKIFLIGLVIFMTASGLCGITPNVQFLIIFRILQGIGGSLMIPNSLSLLSASIDEKEKGKAIGIWSAASTIVTMGGPILGGAFADAGLWRYIFFINLPLGIVALLLLFKAKESQDPSHPPFDIAGAISIAFGLGLLTFGFLQIPSVGLYNLKAAGAIIAGILLLICFIIIQKKSKHPMMPPGLFSNLTFSGANLLTFFLYAGLGSGMIFLSLNLVQVQGYDQLQSGLTFLPFTISMVGISRFAGGLSDKYGPRLLLIFGPSLAGIGLLVLSFVKQTSGPSDYFTSFFPGILLLGIGMSLTVAPLTTAVMGSVSENVSGIASGINNALTRISGVLANAIFGALAVIFFSGALEAQLKNVELTSNERLNVTAQAKNLGDAKLPADINAPLAVQITNVYHSSFISAYGKIMFISSILCFTGSICAVLFIKKKSLIN